MMKNGALLPWWSSTSTVNWSILTSLLLAVDPLGISLTLRNMKRGMWSPPKCRILTSQCANLMARCMNKRTLLTHSASAQSASDRCTSVYSPSFPTDAIATFVYSFPICQKTLAAPFWRSEILARWWRNDEPWQQSSLEIQEDPPLASSSWFVIGTSEYQGRNWVFSL